MASTHVCSSGRLGAAVLIRTDPGVFALSAIVLGRASSSADIHPDEVASFVGLARAGEALANVRRDPQRPANLTVNAINLGVDARTSALVRRRGTRVGTLRLLRQWGRFVVLFGAVLACSRGMAALPDSWEVGANGGGKSASYVAGVIMLTSATAAPACCGCYLTVM